MTRLPSVGQLTLFRWCVDLPGTDIFQIAAGAAHARNRAFPPGMLPWDPGSHGERCARNRAREDPSADLSCIQMARCGVDQPIPNVTCRGHNRGGVDE